MPRIRFTHSAETDLLELWVTIAEENPTAADETLELSRQQQRSWVRSQR
jgi:plasmid stabilization system protein ParE